MSIKCSLVKIGTFKNHRSVTCVIRNYSPGGTTE